MKPLIVLFTLISIFKFAHSGTSIQCVCLKNEDYVNCGTNGLIDNFKRNVALAKMDGSQRLISNSITFKQVAHLRIQCGITGIQLDSIHDQRSIKTLDLSRNELKNFPTNMFAGMTFLEKLHICWNKIKNPTEDTFARLDHLKELDISHNTLTNLNLGVLDAIKNLEKLYLNDNKLSALPTGVFDTLVNLKKLDVSNNKLNKIEFNLFEESRSLEDVNFSGNELSDHQALIGLDSLTSVINLDLSNCKISHIPESVFTRLSKLQKLNLNFNRIRTLSTIFDATKELTTLYMSHNRLTSISSHLFDHNSKLENIDWSYNLLNTLPGGLNLTNSFKYFNLSHNAINQLPLKLFQWSDITEIDLSYNDFITLETELLNMETLERVHAQHNKISYLEDTAFSSCTFPVRYINLQYNRLVYLQEYFFDWLANLERLDIFGNPWDCMCLQDLIKLLTNRFIEYDVENYETTKAICVAGDDRACPYYTKNLSYYYDKYKDIL